jgi:hypothetical protein
MPIFKTEDQRKYGTLLTSKRLQIVVELIENK